MKTVVWVLAVFAVSALALAVPDSALAAGCADQCNNCVSAPMGESTGCIAPNGDDTASMCGEFPQSLCVCVGGVCASTVDPDAAPECGDMRPFCN